jgi:ACS family sodium-dependent inorganic phosphate cotransporter/ACS family sodium-dependent inorganic phosphate cotransporter-like MFS transporter 9
VVLPTALVLLVCNMDRICLSVAILPMAQEYGWPATVQVRLMACLGPVGAWQHEPGCVCLALPPPRPPLTTSTALPPQGLIQSAFLWGYTATQLLGGSLADKYGGRAVIAAGACVLREGALQPL